MVIEVAELISRMNENIKAASEPDISTRDTVFYCGVAQAYGMSAVVSELTKIGELMEQNALDLKEG